MGKGHLPKGRGHTYSWQRGWHAAHGEVGLEA